VLFNCDRALAKFRMLRVNTRVTFRIRQRRLDGGENFCTRRVTKSSASPISWALYNEHGFDVPQLIDWAIAQHNPLPDFPGGGAKMTANEVLFQPADVVIPAAVENQTLRNGTGCRRASCARREWSVHSMADDMSIAKAFSSFRISWPTPACNVRLLRVGTGPPGIFLEREGSERPAEEVIERVSRSRALRGDAQVNNRVAAYMLAIDRVAFALKERGIYA